MVKLMMHQNEQLEARLEHDRLNIKYEYLVPRYKERCFHNDEMAYLSDLLYPMVNKSKISTFYSEYKKCFINGEEYISQSSHSQRSSAISAKWRGIRHTCVNWPGNNYLSLSIM